MVAIVVLLVAVLTDVQQRLQVEPDTGIGVRLATSLLVVSQSTATKLENISVA